jgi:hypothetical protein
MNRGYHLRSSAGSIHRPDRTSGQNVRHIDKITRCIEFACCIESLPEHARDLNKLEQ